MSICGLEHRTYLRKNATHSNWFFVSWTRVKLKSTYLFLARLAIVPSSTKWLGERSRVIFRVVGLKQPKSRIMKEGHPHFYVSVPLGFLPMTLVLHVGGGRGWWHFHGFPFLIIHTILPDPTTSRAVSGARRSNIGMQLISKAAAILSFHIFRCNKSTWLPSTPLVNPLVLLFQRARGAGDDPGPPGRHPDLQAPRSPSNQRSQNPAGPSRPTFSRVSAQQDGQTSSPISCRAALAVPARSEDPNLSVLIPRGGQVAKMRTAVQISSLFRLAQRVARNVVILIAREGTWAVHSC
ncbi:hypothetical protein C8R47DRAFT_1251816 [Mycena vitilis]|nr:hypothetical protein C8R47DRAFT_1251816 [Mycena vitilis]